MIISTSSGLLATVARNLVKISFGCAVLALGFSVPLALSRQGAPIVTVKPDREQVDFGTLQVYAKGTAAIRVTNVGPEPITVQRTGADCTCLSSRCLPFALLPRQSMAWNITLDTCDYVGEVRKNIWLTFDAPHLPPLKLPVRYRVVPDIFVEADFVSLGLVGKDALETIVPIQTLRTNPVGLLEARCDSKWLRAWLESDRTSADSPARLHLVYDGGATEEFPDITLWVLTDSPELPRLRVPVFVSLAPGVRCDQQLIDFGHVPLNTSAEGKVELAFDGNGRVEDVRSSNASVEIAGTTSSESSTRITLRTRPDLPLGCFRGFVSLQLNSGPGASRRARLPYFGRVVETAHASDSAAGFSAVINPVGDGK